LSDKLRIKTFKGSEITPYIPDLAQLRIEIFRDFPYLYDGSIQYEENYLKTYTQSQESLAVIVFDRDYAVGVSTGLPMEDETEEFKKPFVEQGYDPKGIFYFGESILKKKYRGRGIYSRFFKEREKHALSLRRFNTICFCGVIRPEDHPLRPGDHQPLDPIWKKFGYTKYPELTTTYVWKDIDKEEDTGKEMVFWLKEI
jgi:hypothetical protein